jgi:hypothetical protein
MSADERVSKTTPRILVIEGCNVKPERMMLSDDVYTIGRWEQCQLVVAMDDLAVSRLHAKIERDGPRFLLYDLSANGTFVDGQRIDKGVPHMLQDGDEIGLARPRSSLRFVDPLSTQLNGIQLSFNDRTMVFMLNGQELNLAKNQLRLLLHLYRNIGQVCTRESCGEAIYGEFDQDLDADRLERTVATLRQRIAEHFAQASQDQADLIEARRGIGYMLKL